MEEEASELTVARLHRERLVSMIEEQTTRINRSRGIGNNSSNSEKLLELLCNHLNLIDDFIRRNARFPG